MKMLKILKCTLGNFTVGKNYEIKQVNRFFDQFTITAFDEQKKPCIFIFDDSKIGSVSSSGMAEIVMVIDLPTAEQALSYSLQKGKAIHNMLLSGRTTKDEVSDLVAAGWHFASGGYVKDRSAVDDIDSIAYGMVGRNRIHVDMDKIRIDASKITSAEIERFMLSCNNPMIFATDDPTSDQFVLERLRDILQVPEGENILKHAKMVRTLADGLRALSGQPKGVR